MAALWNVPNPGQKKFIIILGVIPLLNHQLRESMNQNGVKKEKGKKCHFLPFSFSFPLLHFSEKSSTFAPKMQTSLFFMHKRNALYEKRVSSAHGTRVPEAVVPAERPINTCNTAFHLTIRKPLSNNQLDKHIHLTRRTSIRRFLPNRCVSATASPEIRDGKRSGTATSLQSQRSCSPRVENVPKTRLCCRPGSKTNPEIRLNPCLDSKNPLEIHRNFRPGRKRPEKPGKAVGPAENGPRNRGKPSARSEKHPSHSAGAGL